MFLLHYVNWRHHQPVEDRQDHCHYNVPATLIIQFEYRVSYGIFLMKSVVVSLFLSSFLTDTEGVSASSVQFLLPLVSLSTSIDLGFTKTKRIPLNSFALLISILLNVPQYCQAQPNII